MIVKITDEVIVYDRYLFAIPVKGKVINIADKDGALQIDFYGYNNPGQLNVIKHNGYFHYQQCYFEDGVPCSDPRKEKQTKYKIYSNPRIEPDNFDGEYICDFCTKFNSKVLQLPGQEPKDTITLICKTCLGNMMEALDDALMKEIKTNHIAGRCEGA